MSNKGEGKPTEQYTELEGQFILRLPEETADELRKVLRSGAPLNNRLSIKLENDMRNAEVKFDEKLLKGKVVDLPCIIESLKVIDKKNTYKTADISQMMICKAEGDESPPREEEESTNDSKGKKNDLKVDKKYQWPHGINPPLKNVRRRRFRKTLKKKSVELPEVEKEVKRLLRGDAEAINVRWEVVTEPDDDTKEESEIKEEGEVIIDSQRRIDGSSMGLEHDIFGEALSDTDSEHSNDDEQGHSSQSYQSKTDRGRPQGSNRASNSNEFSGGMLHFSGVTKTEEENDEDNSTTREVAYVKVEEDNDYPYESLKTENEFDYSSSVPPQNDEDNSFYHIRAKMESLQDEIHELRSRRRQIETDIRSTQNEDLKEELQENLDNVEGELVKKEEEYSELETLLED